MSNFDSYNVKHMEIGPFGQLAEQVITRENTPPYDPDLITAVHERLLRDGQVMGRTVLISAWRDGEVGPQIMVEPINSKPATQTNDPLKYGV
jgi:hypothetical protein